MNDFIDVERYLDTLPDCSMTWGDDVPRYARKAAQRAQIAADVADYLQSGGVVQYVAPGVQTQAEYNTWGQMHESAI